jgi:UDP-N-acetyl-2-amino-2-deoxyglucuronate dehydrogenase
LSRCQPYGVLLVTGLRTHQENYALLFAADPRCRLIAVTDEPDVPAQRADWNRQFASEMNLTYIPDLDEALAREDVDIVSVCAEHERRGRVAVRCAQAGKHLYLDKPITCSVSDADAVVAAVEAAGVRSQMFSFIHNPWAQAAKQAVESGAVGELVAIHCDVMFAKGYAGTATLGKPRKQDPHPKRFTFVDSKLELWTTGVYAVSLIRWLTGAEVRTVFGVTANYFFAEHVRNDVEDFGVLALGLEGGVAATVACGRIGWTSHPAGGPNRLHIIGTEGSLTVDAHKPRIEVCADEPPWTPPPVNPADPMSFWRSTQEEVETEPKESWVPLHGKEESPNDASHFIDCIESGREGEMSAKDGAAVVEVLMAGYASAAKGDVVSLPLPQ